MNRFLKNKKEKAREAKEAKAAREAKDTDEGDNAGGMMSFMKSKKPEPEPKPELDFSSALPSNDDFRTSLLMPKLSARFSMLKDQDNPDSMLGKASDDSVLFPKRASKLNVFGHNPSLLSDIDEVSTECSRPSFAMARADSSASGGDGYGTDDDRSQNGSVMNRPRPGEGNNLFGGRQKVYKIPVKSNGTSPNSESARTMGARAVYEEDIALSPFQRLRVKEKEEAKEKEDRGAEASAHDAPAPESDDALSRMSSAQRTTYSSTASGPAYGRASTAATSVDEPYPHAQSHPSPAAGDIHSPAVKPSAGMASERGSVRSRRLYGQGLAQSAQNQQASTLHRLESLSRQRAGTPELPPPNRNYSRGAANLRDRLQKLAIAEPASTSRPTSPSSSVTSPNRPAVESESKEPKSHRNQAGSVPPLTPPISEDEEGAALAEALQPEDRGKATAMGLFNKPITRFDEQQFTRRQLQMHEGRNTPPLSQRPSERLPQTSFDRQRDLPSASYGSRAESASSQYTGPQRAADHSAAPSVDSSTTKPAGTFFADSLSSESGDETDQRHSAGASSYSSQVVDGVHPALRSGTPSKPSTPTGEAQNAIPEVRYSDLSDLKPIEENDVAEGRSNSSGEAASPEKPDSPTLGPTGLGLSGMVRDHLRRDSDRLSMNPNAAGVPSQFAGYEFETSASIRESTSNDLNPTPLNVGRTQPAAHPSAGDESRESRDESGGLDELRARHNRDASTETQKEREEFAIELAERRRKVQEKLKNFAETESRAGSPVPGSGSQTPDFPQGKPNAFSMLKNKSGKQPGGNVFGLGNTSTPALVSDSQSREDAELFPYSFGKHSNASTPHVGSERPMRPRLPNIGRGSQENSRESSRSRGPSPHSVFRPLRDRSGSETSGRSKSRGRYHDRDELEPLEEGSVASHGTFAFPEYSEPRDSPSIPSSVPSSARPSMEVHDPVYDRSMSAAGRYRSTSRSGVAGHHDTPLQPFYPPDSMGAPPRPSPVAPYSANATPPLYESPRHQSQAHPPSSFDAPPLGIPQRAPGHVGPHRRPINKYKISEPTFVSCTSNVPTFGLPPGANANNGIGAPPVPPMNPRRRRQTTAQTLMGALKGDRPEMHHPTMTEEQRSLSDGVDKAQKPRNRLRKSSSEGGQMNAMARQEAMNDSSPPVPQPQYPQNMPMDGGMI
jgi:hypothetical protein